MDLGTRRRLRREQLRREHGPAPAIFKNETSAAWLALTTVLLGSAAGAFGHTPIAIALDELYCTPVWCATLPQALTGWAIVVAPLAVYLWRRDLAVYLGLFLLSFTYTLFITSDRNIPVDANLINGVWVLPVTCVLVGMLFAPLSIGISQFFTPDRRVLVAALQHWLLLALLILWLA
jgi:hypothetical protein